MIGGMRRKLRERNIIDYHSFIRYFKMEYSNVSLESEWNGNKASEQYVDSIALQCNETYFIRLRGESRCMERNETYFIRLHAIVFFKEFKQ